MENLSGGLPDGWANCTIADVAQLIRGVSYKKPDAIKEPRAGFTPLLRANNIDRSINQKDMVYVRKECVNEIQLLRSGDVLIAMSSGSINLVGKAAQYRGSESETFGAFCGALRPAAGINSRYFGWFFQSRAYRESVSASAKGSNINNLKRDHILELQFSIPPLNEQRRIVEKIETLFARLDQGEAELRQVQTLLARYRQSVLKAAVTGQLTADWRTENAHRLEPGQDLLARILKTRRETWQGRGQYKKPTAPDTSARLELPDSWTWATVEQVSSAVDYGSSAKCSPEPIGIPVLRMGNIIDGKLNFENLKFLPNQHHEFPKLLLEAGDLLFNRTNSAELVGKTAVFKGDPSECSFASYLIRVRMIEVDSDFVSAFINSIFGRAWVRSVVSQQVGQANVNGSKLKALSIPLPPRDEQKEIIERMTEKLSRMEVVGKWCQTELTRSIALRQSILKQAFAGRLVPQDPNDEPASELLARIRAAQPAAKGQTRKKVSA